MGVAAGEKFISEKLTLNRGKGFQIVFFGGGLMTIYTPVFIRCMASQVLVHAKRLHNYE